MLDTWKHGRGSGGKLMMLLACMLANTRAMAGDVALPLNDINVMIVTDVHSWIAGHEHPDHLPLLNASYGDVVSLFEHIQASADAAGRDLFFVQNGDLNDGTGFSRMPPEALVPLLQKMPFDALTTGNHELYHNEMIEYLAQPGGFVDSWGGRFLTSNVLNATTLEPIGARSRLLVGRTAGKRVLAFGFLYDMRDHGDAVVVRPVEEIVEEAWFIHMLNATSSYDALLFLAHMDYADPLVDTIHHAVRAIVGEAVPVQFVTGHSHIRAVRGLDAHAASFEAGHYLDTIGFTSFPLVESRASSLPPNGLPNGLANGFAHVNIDANVAAMAKVVGLEPDEFATPAGEALQDEIGRTAASLGIARVLGCSPHLYLVDAPLEAVNSLWRLYLQNVTVSKALGGNSSKVVLQSTGSLRYNLYAGAVTLNDIYTMTPFADRFWRVAQRISGDDLTAMVQALNPPFTTASNENRSRLELRARGGRRIPARTRVHAVEDGQLPQYTTTSAPEPNLDYELWTLDYDLSAVSAAVAAQTEEQVEPQLMLSGANTTDIWAKWVSEEWACSPKKGAKARKAE